MFALFKFSGIAAGLMLISNCFAAVIAPGVIDYYTKRDLEMVTSLNNSHNGVVGKLDRTLLPQGRHVLEALLTNPLTDVTVLTLRQQAIKTLADNQLLCEKISFCLTVIRSELHGLQALKTLQDDAVAQDFIARFYYSWPVFNQLNENSAALNIKHAMSVLWGPAAPLLEHALFHFALEHAEQKITGKKDEHAHGSECHGHHHDHGHDVHSHGHHHDHEHFSFNDLIKGTVTAAQWAHFAYHAVSFVEAFDVIQQRARALNGMYTALVSLKRILYFSEILQALVTEHTQLRAAFTDQVSMQIMSSDLAQELEPLIDQMDDSYFAQGSNLHWYSFVGKTLTGYKLYQQSSTAVDQLLLGIGALDAFVSMARLVTEHRTTENTFSFVTFASANKPPQFKATGLWNVMLPADKAVANDIGLDAAGAGAHVVLTGPNKSGKTSLLKAAALAGILAQSFGVAPARTLIMTPFTNIITFMTVLDDIAHDASSAVARILRTDIVTKSVRSLGNNQHALVLLDDSVGQGTTFEKGQEAAYNLFKDVGASNNTLMLGATHFEHLTTLAKTMPNQFANWRIKIVQTNDGTKASAFTLEPGVCPAGNVYDLVYAQGFVPKPS
jgi:DNA mismatch repair protein MutS